MRDHAEWRRFFLATAGVVSLALSVVAGALTAAQLRAQAPPAQSPATQLTAIPRWQTDTGGKMSFDVASVKRSKPGEGPQYMLTKTEAGRLIATGAPLRTLIAMAYQLKPDETRFISGQPEWAKSETFDIEGKAEGDPSREQLDLMLQSLLADRFKLAIHRETRQAPVYALVLSRKGRTGPNLQPHSDAAECLEIKPGQPVPTSDFGVTPPPPPACGRFITGARRLAGNNVTIDDLVRMLGAMASIDRPVVNRAGLSGGFDLNLEYTPQTGQGTDANADPAAPPSIFTALQEQLGLKLDPTNGPVKMLVIDHVEEPSPN
jgi:uncharacterized protein (TIGR03435 family)